MFFYQADTEKIEIFGLHRIVDDFLVLATLYQRNAPVIGNRIFFENTELTVCIRFEKLICERYAQVD